MNIFTAFSIVLQAHGNPTHSIWQARPGSVSSDPTSLVLSKNQTTRALSTYKFGSSFGFVRSKTSEIGFLCRLIFLESVISVTCFGCLHMLWRLWDCLMCCSVLTDRLWVRIAFCFDLQASGPSLSGSLWSCGLPCHSCSMWHPCPLSLSSITCRFAFFFLPVVSLEVFLSFAFSILAFLSTFHLNCVNFHWDCLISCWCSENICRKSSADHWVVTCS